MDGNSNASYDIEQMSQINDAYVCMFWNFMRIYILYVYINKCVYVYLPVILAVDESTTYICSVHRHRATFVMLYRIH